MTATILAAEARSAASQTNSKNRLVNKITAQPSPACKQTPFHAEARAGQVLEKASRGCGNKGNVSSSCIQLGLCLHPLLAFEVNMAATLNFDFFFFSTHTGKRTSEEAAEDGGLPVKRGEMAGKGLRWSLSVDSANNVREPKPSNRAGDMIRGREGTRCTVSHIARGHFVLLHLPC